MMGATNVEAKVQQNTGQVDTPQTGSVNEPQAERIYRYEDEKGNLLFEVVRFTPKGFAQRRPDGKGGYIYNLSGVRRVLYRLPELIAEPLQSPVFICEGEKDVDRLMSLGLPATTNPGGAGKWKPEFNIYLRGRPCGVLQDNDEVGRLHAKAVAESLCGIAASVKVVELPGLPPKGDVSDWLDAGNDPRKLTQMFLDAPEYVMEEPWTTKAVVKYYNEIEPEDIDWLLPQRIPKGEMTIFAGDPGAGKSYLTLYLAAIISRGLPGPDGTKTDTGETIILSPEDSPEHTIRPRLDALGADVSKIMTIPIIRHKDEKGNVTTDVFNILHDRLLLEEQLSKNPNIKLIVVDPLSSYFGSVDTHKDSNVRVVLDPLVGMARRFNVALVCVMHLNKGNSTKACYRTQGSLAFNAQARATWFISKDGNDANGLRRLMVPGKINIVENPTGLAFEIKDGRVIFEDKPVDITADDVLAPRGNIEAPERQRAVEWLKEILSSVDSMPSNEIFKLAEEERFNERMLARARKELGIKCFPEFDEEGNKSWHWRLPKAEGEQLKLPNLSDTLAKLQKMKQSMKMP